MEEGTEQIPEDKEKINDEGEQQERNDVEGEDDHMMNIPFASRPMEKKRRRKKMMMMTEAGGRRDKHREALPRSLAREQEEEHEEGEEHHSTAQNSCRLFPISLSLTA